MTQMAIVLAETLRRQLLAVFTRWGMSDADAEVAARIMVDTDLSGVDSHGVGMLPHYWKIFSEGRLDPKAVPAVVVDDGPLSLIDGKKAIGHVSAHLAIEEAIRKAVAYGVGVACVTNSNHYGAAGWYARRAAERNLIAVSLTNSSPLMVPVHGTEAALGTNPIAFSAPTHDPARPVLLDMATTTVAFGKVSIARRAGKALPPGWALDEGGAPELDSTRASELRRLAPLGGTRQQGAHKGYGLALMVEILSATLAGAGNARDATGHFFLVLDPGRFQQPAAFRDGLGVLLGALRANPPADAETPVLIPGDPEHEAGARRTANGIPMAPTLLEEIRTVCAQCGAPFLLDEAAP